MYWGQLQIIFKFDHSAVSNSFLCLNLSSVKLGTGVFSFKVNQISIVGENINFSIPDSINECQWNKSKS